MDKRSPTVVDDMNTAATKTASWWRLVLAYLCSFLALLVIVVMTLGFFVAAAMEHWLASALLAILYGAMLPLGFTELKQPLEPRKALGVIVLMIAITIAVFASLSFAAQKLQPTSYAGDALNSGRDAEVFGTFISYFAWLFLELLPVLEVNKTLQLASPVQPVSTVAGLLVVVFRGFVVLLLLKAIKDWWQRATKAQPPTPNNPLQQTGPP